MFRTKKGTRRGKRKGGGDKSRKRREKRKKIKTTKEESRRKEEEQQNKDNNMEHVKEDNARAERKRMRRVAAHIQKHGWEVVLMTEIT